MGRTKIEKTNAARLLDRAGIAYELIPYAVDEEHLAAVDVAEQLGEPIECVFKTLVLRGDRTGCFVCVVPGDHEVDLKAAARISGNKKADLVPVKELLALTGYIRRMLARGHEARLSDLRPPHGDGACGDLRQRRGAGLAAAAGAAGAHRLRGGYGRRPEPSGVVRGGFGPGFGPRRIAVLPVLPAAGMKKPPRDEAERPDSI